LFLLVLLSAIVVAVACSSRYRLELFLAYGDVNNRVEVESTEFVEQSTINDPYAEQKLRVGDGNCLIVITETRGDAVPSKRWAFLGFDERLRCRIYVELPTAWSTGTYELEERSFVHVMGRYDQPARSKIFLADAGALVIDSLKDKRFYGTINGTYANEDGTELKYQGQFRAKYRR
jgi:hypothetical protein